MTDFANLVLKVDSSQVREGVAELDKLVPAGQRVEAAAGRMAAAQDRVTASAGAQRAGMQQLSFQIGDVAQQFALGTNPMIIFAQQGGQVVQALNLMKGGASGLIGFLAGPWGAVIMGAASVAGMFAAKLWETKDAADGAAEGYKNAAAEARNLIGAQNAVALNQKRMGLNKLVEERMRIESKLASRPKNPDGSAMFSYSDNQRLQEIKWQEIEARNLIKIADAENDAIEKKARVTEKATVSTRSARGATSQYAKAMREAKRDADALTKSLDDLALSTMNGLVDTMREARETQAALFNDDLRGVQEEMAKAQDGRINAAREEAEAQAELNDQLRDLIGNLDRLGGMGSVLGDIGSAYLGLKSGDFRGVRGGAGYLAQWASGIQWATIDQKTGDRTIYKLGEEFSKALDDVFGANGSFLKILQNAGVGAAIGGMVFGQGNKGAQVGSTIGGAFGEAAFKSITPKLFSSLGSFAGPLGTIAGSLIGGLFGGLFSKTKTGSASVSNGKVTGGGNNDEMRGQSSGIAGQIGSSLANIANALGGSVGSYAYTIGMRKDEYRVSGSAGANVTSKNPGGLIYRGKDAAEAARIALLNAIQDGAIQGIMEGAARLLKAGTDIEVQVSKAIKFQNVFEELKAATDPVGASLDALTKQFNELRAIFDEAGASAAEYAQLEQLLAIKRKEITDDDERKKLEKLNDRRSLEVQLLEAQGKVQEALALQREIELSQTEEGLRGLMRQIYAARDLAAANEKIAVSANETITRFSQLADSLRSYRDSLTGEGGGALTRNQALVRLMSTGGLAAAGNADAMGQLQGVSEAFLDVSRKNAGSAIQYRRDVAISAGYIDKAIRAADGQVSSAQAQIEALRSIDTSASETAAAMAADGVVGFAAVESVKVNNSLLDEIKALREETAALREEVASSRRDDERYSLRMIELNSSMERIWKRAEIEGLPIQNDPTNPITVVSA